MELRYGRTVQVAAVEAADVLEIRDASGTLELRLRLTDDGVVLQLEGARISLKADDSIDLESRNINLKAESDVRIRGGRVYLN
jgi:hypothetical protein